MLRYLLAGLLRMLERSPKKSDRPYDPLDPDDDEEAWEEKEAMPPAPPPPDEDEGELADENEPESKDARRFRLLKELSDYIAAGDPMVDRLDALGPFRLDLNGTYANDEKSRDAEAKGYNLALVGFYPHDSAHPFRFVIEKNSFLDDAEGNPVAIVTEGPVTAYFGTRIFLTVTWLTKNPVARGVARLRGAPWIAVHCPVTVKRAEDDRGYVRNDLFRDELETQLDLDVASGRMRPEFAEFIREKIGTDYARFFVAYVVGMKSPMQSDQEPVYDEERRMSYPDR